MAANKFSVSATATNKKTIEKEVIVNKAPTSLLREEGDDENRCARNFFLFVQFPWFSSIFSPFVARQISRGSPFVF